MAGSGFDGAYASLKAFLGRSEQKICTLLLFTGWLFPTVILFLSGRVGFASIAAMYLVVFPVSPVLFVLSILSLRVYSRWFWFPIVLFFVLSVPIILWNFDF
ncbi:hypothetical protein [uncultured Roseibium sp.]|uniref:hypothetical protein n=1 Tax=uncultured Roseibium sp. TaxID=1936171 RepID=UPI0032179E69